MKRDLDLTIEDEFKLCLDELRRYHGMAPYEEGRNLFKNSGSYLRSLIKKYKKDTFAKAELAINIEKREWAQLRAEFVARHQRCS